MRRYVGSASICTGLIGLFENVNAAFLATWLEEDDSSTITAESGCTTYAMKVIILAESWVVLNDQVEVWKVEPTRGNICG